MILPRLVQKYPELWIWDYSDSKHNPGFCICIVEIDGTCWHLHFNKHWDGKAKYRHPNTKVDDFVKSNFNRKYLVDSGIFKIESELV